jgi:flagellar hook-length control protein FliK
VAATRSAIESSLPTLAAALADGGFTLTGGGVFGGAGQQAGRQDADNARFGLPQRGRDGADTALPDGPARAPALPARARGLVDLVA